MSLLIMEFGNEIHNSMCKAIYTRDIDKVSSIIDEFGVSYCPTWCGGRSLLLTAIDCRYPDIARLLLAKGSSLLGGALEKSLIHSAVKLGDLELISDMLDKNKNLIRVTEKNETVLHLAVADGKVAVVRLLLNRGVELERQNTFGKTALHLAAVHGHTEVLQILLQAGASVEITDHTGKTALFFATSSNQRAAANILLQWGSDCNFKCKNGISPLIDLTHKGSASCINIFRDLVAYGADLNIQDCNGQTPLHVAVNNKDIQMIEEILERGADFNVTDNNGMSPCDGVIKVNLLGMTFFEHSRVVFVLAKFLLKMNEICFQINNRNRAFLQLFLEIYSESHRDIGDSIVQLADRDTKSLPVLQKGIQEEVSLMKSTRNASSISVFNILQKFKNSNTLNLMTKREIQFLESIDLTLTFPYYENILKYLINKSKYRNELITSGQECLSFILSKSEINLPVLPEEILTQIVLFITNDDLRKLIKWVSRVKP